MKPDHDMTSLTPLAQGAAQTHELYQSYVEAGFTKQEALYLIGQMLGAVMAEGARRTPDA